ncbi:MAG: hypothetical protein E3J78_07765, partial [Candidatus Cloacimonadota bacterium]
MDENKGVNEDLSNIISSFEKRTQQISEEQRESRERFVVALSELSRQYDLLREWAEKTNKELTTFLEKLHPAQDNKALLQSVTDIGNKIDSVSQQSSHIAQIVETELKSLGETFVTGKSEEKLLQPIMVIADRIDQIVQELTQSLQSIENEIKDSLARMGESEQTGELIQISRTIAETLQSIPEGFSEISKLWEVLERMSNDVSTQFSEIRVVTSNIEEALGSLFSTLKESNEKLVNATIDSKDVLDNFSSALKENGEYMIALGDDIKNSLNSLATTFNEN